jgi:nucleolar protein 58
LGAEKALFRALKTKHATPKYGLIYHASLIGQAAPKNKGKISRVLAAKAALAVRVDALSDDTTADGQDMMVDTTIGYEGRAKVEARLRQLEGGSYRAVVAATGTEGRLTAAKTAKYDPVAAKTAATGQAYNTASDMVLEAKDEEDEEESPKKKKKKSKRDSNGGEDEDAEKSSKKKKKEKKRKAEEEDHDDNGDGNASRAVEIKEEEEPKKKKAKKENGEKEKRKSKD